MVETPMAIELQKAGAPSERAHRLRDLLRGRAGPPVPRPRARHGQSARGGGPFAGSVRSRLGALGSGEQPGEPQAIALLALFFGALAAGEIVTLGYLER